MPTPTDTRTSDVDEVVNRFVAECRKAETSRGLIDISYEHLRELITEALTSFRESVVTEEREQLKKTAFNIRHCAKTIVASLGDPIRTQIELEHLKGHIKALTPPKETHK